MKNKKTIAIIVVMCMLMSMVFSACGKDDKDSDKKSKTIVNQTATIKDSGWTYDTTEGIVYYALTVHNDSTKYVCSGADITVTIKKSGGKKDTDNFTTCRIMPDSDVTVAVEGLSLDSCPEDVSFKLGDSSTWEEDTVLQPLEITSEGTRYPEYEYEYEGSEELDLTEDWSDIFEGEDMSEYQTEYVPDNIMTEFYGTIMNPNSADINGAVIYIVFKDSSGKIIGGSSTTVNDGIAPGGSADYSIIFGDGLNYSSYEVHAYAR